MKYKVTIGHYVGKNNDEAKLSFSQRTLNTMVYDPKGVGSISNLVLSVLNQDIQNKELSVILFDKEKKVAFNC